MVTYFNKKDLVEFGNWLFSKQRENSFIHTSAQAMTEGIEFNSSWERLRTVTHADVCNFIELQRNKQRAAKVEEPKADVPQWLKDHTATTFSQKFQIPKLGPQWLQGHMATAPKELQEYVLKVFPERCTNINHIDLSLSFRWKETPEGHIFWTCVDLKNWVLALVELREKNLL